ncbi:MAG: hypothetical protein WBM90_13575 [Acidimicrobiia bacterium]
MKVSRLSALPVGTAVMWCVALIIDPAGYDSEAVLLIGVGILLLTTVGVVGLVVVGGRWAHRLVFVSLAATFILAAVRPVDAWWVAGVVLSAASVLVMLLPAITSSVRRLPAAEGLPTRALMAPLLLIGVPFEVGIVTPNATWAVAAVGLSAPVAAFAYSRVIPGGLLAIRILWPAVAIGFATVMPPATAMVSIGTAFAVVILAWHPTVKTAYHPPREVGSRFPIPPELTPREVLDAAEIDDRGNPL